MKKELQGWISVNDLLPSPIFNVFVKSEKGMFNTAVTHINGVWYPWDSTEPLRDIFKPTHWISKEDILNIN